MNPALLKTSIVNVLELNRAGLIFKYRNDVDKCCERAMKQCSKCKQELPETKFRKGSNNGLQAYCKPCQNKVNKIHSKRYREKHPELFRNYRRKYQHSERGKETRRLWRQTETGKQCISEQIKIWRKTDKGKQLHRKHAKIRKAKMRGMKLIPLWDNPFPEKTHYHHVNNLIVIPLPEKTHLFCYGKKHRERCKEMIEKIYCIDLGRILCP